MSEEIFKWFRKASNKMVHSIAFFPALMGGGFLLFSMLVMELDSQGVGEQLNNRFRWLTLKDPTTARSIVSTVATGIISLMVFSFSMVMIVMSQAASQMSNRLLDNIIGERFQKLVLGFYIGTIIYALFLFTNISEVDKEMKVPSLSVYLLLAFTICDIFFFVYFLHHITQTFRYEQLIKRLHKRTSAILKRWATGTGNGRAADFTLEGQEILAVESGYFQGFSLKRIMKFAVEHNLVIRFLQREGSYVLAGTPFLIITGKNLKQESLNKLFSDIDFYYGQEVDKNPYYGFQHLTEVGVKALSPGINDPGTAVLSLNALTELLAFSLNNRVKEVISDDKGQPRIITKEVSFEELFESSVLPIWDYGKKDRIVQNGIGHLLNQLMFIDKEKKYYHLFSPLQSELESYTKRFV